MVGISSFLSLFLSQASHNLHQTNSRPQMECLTVTVNLNYTSEDALRVPGIWRCTHQNYDEVCYFRTGDSIAISCFKK